MSSESNWLHWNIHLKIVKILNVTWCMFYHKAIKMDLNKKNNSQVSKNFLYKVSLEEPNNNTRRRIWSFVAIGKHVMCGYGVCSAYISVHAYAHSQENTHVPPIQSPLSLFPVLGMQHNKHPCSSSSSSKETTIINSNITHRCHQKKYLQPWAPTRSPLLHTCKGCRNLEGQSSPKESQDHSRNPRLTWNAGRYANLRESFPLQSWGCNIKAECGSGQTSFSNPIC